MNYVLIGVTINNLMLCDKILKNGDKCIIYEKKNIDELYENYDNINSQPFFSSNDVNFIDWLKSINLKEYDAGIPYNLNFNFTKQIKITELFNLYNNISNKEILMVYLQNNNFCKESIDYIKKICIFFNKQCDNINLCDFMHLVNSKLYSDFYIINKQSLVKKILKNTNILEHITWSHEIINTYFDDNQKVIFDIKLENIKKINKCLEKVCFTKRNFYNLFWDSKINFPVYLKNDLTYFDLTNNFTLNNHVITDDITDINDKLFFLEKPSKVVVYKNKFLKENIINKNIIFLRKSKIIEDDIINSLYILKYTDLSYVKQIRIYKGDTVFDILKIYFYINICLKLFKF